MAGLGVAFVSIHAARGELATGRLKRVRLRGLRIQRHFHVIHNEGAKSEGSRASLQSTPSRVAAGTSSMANERSDSAWSR
jgi:hypothetical protein